MAQIDLNIDGYPTIKIDESFKSLSPAEQQKTVDEILASLGPPKDTGLTTAFAHGDAMAQANTLDFAADINQSLDDGFLGKATRAGQEYIGNPVREALGFDPVTPEAQDAANRDLETNTRAMAQRKRDEAEALNYRSLTTDDVDGVGSALSYGSQKVAESLPYMATAMAAPFMSPLMMGGEVNEELKTIEGMDLDKRVAFASTGGLIMGILENLGAGIVLKGMPKEVVGKLGVKGIADFLTKNGAGRVAAAFSTAAVSEGLTETGQDITKMSTAALAGKEYTSEEVKRNLKESFFAGAAGGGGTRATGQTVAETAKVADAALDAIPTKYKKIVQADEEATADFVRDLQNMEADFTDRDVNKLEDADATIDDVHTNYQHQLDARLKLAKANGVDVDKAEVKAAVKRAKNKVKNEASNADIEIITAIDPEAGAIARKLNVVTRFKREGVKGGVSRITDQLNPLNFGSGRLGFNVGSARAMGAGSLAILSGATTLAAVPSGRVIDAITGSRNRVKKAIKQYSKAPGIASDTSQVSELQEAQENAAQTALADREARDAETAEQKNIAIEAVKAGDPAPAPEGNLSPQATVEKATGLDRKGVANAIKILKKTRPHLAKAINDYHLSVAMQKAGPNAGNVENLTTLIRAIKGVAPKAGIKQVAKPDAAAEQQASSIRNPIAYQAAVDNARSAADSAAQAAPNPELQQLALTIANARTRALKKEVVARAKAQYPEHAQYVDQVLEPLTQYGPKDTTIPEVQESRFAGSIDEARAEVQAYSGERVQMLHHGTSQDKAEQYANGSFGDKARFMTAVPESADSFAQDYRGQKDNGRVTTVWTESVFNRLMRNGLITRPRRMEGDMSQPIEYEVKAEAFNQAEDTFRSRSLFNKGNKLSDKDKAKLIARALTEGFKFETDASENSFNRREQLIKLTQDATKVTVLHEIFHAVENRLSEGEMNTLKAHPLFKQVMEEVNELYPDLNIAAKTMEVLAEMSARLEAARHNETGPKYLLGKIKDLIQRFLSLLNGDGFRTVNSVLNEIYSGKAYQRGVNEAYNELYVPQTQFAKVKHGSPMLKKRREELDKIEAEAKMTAETKRAVQTAFDEATETLAENLDIEGVTPAVIKRMLGGMTPNTDLSMLATSYLKAIGVMEEDGRIEGVVETKDGNEVEDALAPYRDNFLIILKALQSNGIIGEFEVAFRTSAGGVMYPIYTVEPKDGKLAALATLNNSRKYVNRATKEPRTEKPQINRHDLGSYENTEAFIEREMQQPLVINDMMYKLMRGFIDKPRHYRGLDLVFKKDGTTDSAYTLAGAEAVKQYEDNQTDNGGMSPVYMLRRAQDRLRIDTLNGSASYQGKAGKALWEFPNWRSLGDTGFEQFLHSIRDHLGIGNEVPYNQRAGIIFGTVGQYMDLAGRPKSEHMTEEDLAMPLIDYMVSGSKMPGGNIFAYQRGGSPMIFNDKRDAKTVYQKNHAVFDVADHGFEIQRLAVELGRMRAFLEKLNPAFKKMPTSELFQNDEALAALADFKSAYPVWFDGTSSAYQLHAALTGDPGLSSVANLLSMDPDAPGGDLYRLPADHVQAVTGLGATKSRKVAKTFLANRRSYGQVKITARGAGFDQLAKQLPEQFNDMQDPQQKETLKDLQNHMEMIFDQNYPGAAMAEGISRSIAKTLHENLGKENFAVRVPLPDGDVAVYDGKLPDSAKRRVNWEISKDKKIGVPVFQDKLAITGFAAFLNHALDAYVQRELAKRLRANGVEGFMHTHDAFAVHPQHGQMMRELYHQILLEVAKSPIYEEVLRANGLNPDNMSVRFNTQTPDGPVRQEQTMSDVLRQIREMKSVTFGSDTGPNFYALS